MTTRYKEIFPQKNTLLAVVHSLDVEHTIENVKIAVDNGLHGAFLINLSMSGRDLIHIFRETRKRLSDVWLGINLLDFTMGETVRAVSALEKGWQRVDGIWTDHPEIRGIAPRCNNQDVIAEAIRKSGWRWLYFGWLFFRHNTVPEDLAFACDQWRKYLDVLTVSGGKTIDIENIKKARKLSQGHPIALASGVNHHNIHQLSWLIDAFIVGDSLSKSSNSLDFDVDKVQKMATILRDINR